MNEKKLIDAIVKMDVGQMETAIGRADYGAWVDYMAKAKDDRKRDDDTYAEMFDDLPQTHLGTHIDSVVRSMHTLVMLLREEGRNDDAEAVVMQIEILEGMKK